MIHCDCCNSIKPHYSPGWYSMRFRPQGFPFWIDVCWKCRSTKTGKDTLTLSSSSERNIVFPDE